MDRFKFVLQQATIVCTALFMVTLVTPALAQQQEYSLADLLQQALESNHTIKAQIKELKSKDAAAAGARGLTGPYIEFSGGYQQQGEMTGLIPAHGKTIPAEFDDVMTSYSLTAKQVLYDAGKTQSLVTFQHREKDWQRANVYKEKLVVAGEVTKSFYRILQLNDTITAQKEVIDALDAGYGESKLLLDVGRIAEVDVMQVEAQIAVEKEKLARYEGQLAAQAAALEALLGSDLPERFHLVGRLTDYTLPGTVSDQSLALNPELAKAKLRQEQAADLLQAAKADQTVRVTVNGEYSHKFLSQGSSDEMWIIGVQAKWPVFDGGVIAAAIRQAEGQNEKAAEQVAQVVVDMKTADTTYRGNQAAANARVESARKAWKRADEVYRILKLSYQSGRSSATEMLVAQATAANAHTAYYQALYDRIEAEVNLAVLHGQMPYDISGETTTNQQGGKGNGLFKN